MGSLSVHSKDRKARLKQKRDIIVMGGSAGGLDALKTLLPNLPADLKAACFIVLHTSAKFPSLLPQILDRIGRLRALAARDSELIVPGRIYVAVPDYHLLVERNHIRLWHGPKENYFRPAVDPLFKSAAQVYGPRVVGVLLSGGLNCGTAGLAEIKKYGGKTIIQDPLDAAIPSMPKNALNNVEIDYCLKISDIAPVLVKLAQEEVSLLCQVPASYPSSPEKVPK